MAKATVAVALSMDIISKLDRLCETQKRNRSQQVEYLILEAEEE